MRNFWRNLGASFFALLGWAVAVIVIFWVSLGCVTTPTPVAFVSMPDGIGGQTTCDQNGKPLVVINHRFRNNPLADDFMIHEAVHVRQMNSYPGGCEAFLYRYNTDDQFRYDSELEARCAEILYSKNPEAARARIVEYMTLYYPGDEVTCKGGDDGRSTSRPRGVP